MLFKETPWNCCLWDRGGASENLDLGSRYGRRKVLRQVLEKETEERVGLDKKKKGMIFEERLQQTFCLKARAAFFSLAAMQRPQASIFSAPQREQHVRNNMQKK